VQLGFALPYAGSWATAENQAIIALQAERLGYASLWTAHRLLYPEHPSNDYPAAPGQPWPEPFRRIVDPVVPLAFVAAVTTRIRIGTAALVLPCYQPVPLAKQLATLDVLSGGRLDVGVCLGWSRDEYTAAGVPWAGRGARFEEYLAALIATWRGNSTSFSGQYVTLPPAGVLPEPVQRPHPPLLIGGYSDIALRRAARFGQGYLGGNMPLDSIVGLLDRLAVYTAQAGREPLRLVCRGSTVVTDTASGADRRLLTGTPAQIISDVQRYAAAGVDELFLDLNFDPAVGSAGSDAAAAVDRALQLLEQLAPYAAADPAQATT
jgi:probable F420-dependent oxidoreductase